MSQITVGREWDHSQSALPGLLVEIGDEKARLPGRYERDRSDARDSQEKAAYEEPNGKGENSLRPRGH